MASGALVVDDYEDTEVGSPPGDPRKLKLGEGQVLVGRDVLIAEKDHKVIEQGLADIGDCFIAQISGQVDAGYFRAERTGHGANIERLGW